MINYDTWCRIRTLHLEHHLGAGQIARKLDLDPKTVRNWMQKECYQTYT